MSYQATEAVLRYSKADNAARLVLIVIAAHADERGRDSYPGVPLICRESRLSERAVRYAIRQLVESGELVNDQPSAGRVPAVYSINLPTLQNSSLNPANRAGFREPTLQNSSLNPAKFVTQPCKIRRCI